jgi:hypothetical protein
VDSATVVWIAPAGAERPRQAEHALDEWGRSHGLHLEAPNHETAPRLPVDQTIADGIEEELEKARDASSALDTEAVEGALASAEATLRQHPELPQGAWLMAEVERGWARRWASMPPKDPERAAAAWRRARGLDGGREPGLGEASTPTSDPEVAFEFFLDGEGNASLDGRPVSPGAGKSAPGEHQLTVTRKGVLVWAGWVGVGQGAVVRVAPPGPVPCSAEDLGHVVVDGNAAEGKVVRSSGVRCPLWVLADPEGTEGRLLVTSCKMDRCGALLEWRVNGAGSVVPGGAVASTWPAWASWTLVGVGAAAIAGVTIGIDAAFHSGAAPAPFVLGGCKGCMASSSSLEPAGTGLRGVKKR